MPSVTPEQAAKAVAGLAEWSAWLPFAEAHDVPLLPGVYLFRLPATRAIVYAGMAGERAGAGGAPQGLRGRLAVYRRGRGAVSGFGEAALDRALADPAWVEGQLVSLREAGPKRAKLWASEAIEHAAPQVSWAVRPSAADAEDLEDRVLALLGPHGLWNRRLPAPSDEAASGAAANHLLTVRGHTLDLDVLYREMHRHSVAGPDGQRVYAGNAPGVPAVKRLLHDLFGVPVADGIHPVNNAVRSEVRDRLDELGWATKDLGRTGRYVLHREL